MNVMQGWMSNFELLPHTIFLTLAGSHAYGLNTPESDIDLRGISIPPKDYIFGFSKRFEQCEKKGDSDVVIYNIDKFFNLASNANPSIMELLWTEPRFHVITTKYYEMLMEVRELFLSKKVAFTFTGYAHSQLKRIKTHRAWLLNPPTHKPTREEFGLTQTREVSRDQEGAFKSVMSRALGMEAEKVIIENIEPSYLPKNTPLNFLEYLTKENRYDSAMDNWKSYENWKANRNPARAILEERFGYDVKHASHLVRLITMGKEILTTGKVKVFRDDAEIFRGIRQGRWEYDQLIEWMDTQEAEIMEFYKFGTSPIPKTPDVEKLNDACVKIQEAFLSGIK